jgi:hypothetical protein
MEVDRGRILIELACEYIREFYYVKYEPKGKVVYFTDSGEDEITNKTPYIIVREREHDKVLFFWEQAKKYIGIDLRHKDTNILSSIILKLLRHEETIDLYNRLIKENKPFRGKIEDLSLFFPNIYSENFNQIISESIDNQKYIRRG